MGIFYNLLKGIWDIFPFTSKYIGYWYPPYTSLKRLFLGGIYFITETLQDQGTNLLVIEFVGAELETGSVG